MLRLLKGDDMVDVRLVDERAVAAMEEGGAVVELRHQDGVGAGDQVGGEAGQEEQVHGKDEEKADSAKLHPLVSHQRQAEWMPVQNTEKAKQMANKSKDKFKINQYHILQNRYIFLQLYYTTSILLVYY